MLPQALQRTERPPEALAEQRSEAVRNLGVADRVGFVIDSIARPADPPGQIHILSHRVGAISAGLHHGIAPPRSNCARDDGHAAEPRKRAPLQVLRRHIFERLPFRDDVDPVADFCITGNRRQPLIGGKPACQASDRIRLELRIGVQRHDDLALGRCEPMIERARLAAVFERDQMHSRVLAERTLDHLRGLVLGSVVDHDNFDPNVLTCEDLPNGPLDHAFFVERRDQHADECVRIDFGALAAHVLPR